MDRDHMKIAFLHYHLKTGGVTTVIKQQVQAIRQKAEVLVLAGEAPSSPWPVETIAIPGLGYDNPKSPSISAEQIARAIHTAICNKWPKGCDVLHVHNPTLAKNQHLLAVCKILQKSGVRLFLHIHDFAEDGRPDVYTAESYPADCHYGVLNTSDYLALKNAGLKPQGLHLLPNAVTLLPVTESSPAAFVLYPVRAIRRKNIGEAVLLSCFFIQNETLAITLPPNSREDMLNHIGWQTFTRSKRLNVVFDAGLRQDFASLISSARYLITTSINEGFGFTFLEPWIAGKMLWGRRLPGVCSDFEEKGLDLNHLYTRIEAPIAWFDGDKFVEKSLKSYLAACRIFKQPCEANTVKQIFTEMVQKETIDFGLLDEAFQKKIIARITKDADAKARMIKLNSFLVNPGQVKNPRQVIAQNKKAVSVEYGQKKYAKRLLKNYTDVIHQPVKHTIDKSRLLNTFLDPHDFSLLKWGQTVFTGE
jgi:hypothetical protein